VFVSGLRYAVLVCAVSIFGGVAYGDTLTFSSGLLQDAGFSLDLGSRDLIIYSTGAERQQMLDRVTALLKQGYDGGKWQGAGLSSSAAANDPTHQTGLAVMLNDDGFGHPIYNFFDNKPVDINSILVKYTLMGDVDLNGKIDGSDYFRLDKGFLAKSKGYANGDVDFSGTIDGSDYFVIDKAFLSRSPEMGDSTAVVAASAIPLPNIAYSCLAMLGTLASVRLVRRMRAAR